MSATVRRTLDTSTSPDPVHDRIAHYHRSVLDEVIAAVDSEPLVVVGMAQNPHVKRVRRALDTAGLRYRYLEYGSYLTEWRRRLTIKMWSGWPTFPQVFVAGVLIGGADETARALEDGSLRRRLAES